TQARSWAMKEFPLIEVSGAAFQMGWQHGRQAEPLIRKYVEWIDKLADMEREKLRHNALRFFPSLRSSAVHTWTKFSGSRKATRLRWRMRSFAKPGPRRRQWDGGCTAFALTGRATADGNPIAGQNQDLEEEYADVGIILRVRPSDGRLRAVMFTFAN